MSRLEASIPRNSSLCENMQGDSIRLKPNKRSYCHDNGIWVRDSFLAEFALLLLMLSLNSLLGIEGTTIESMIGPKPVR